MIGHIIIAMTSMLLDRLIGDPRWFPHPVRLMGSWIRFWDMRWNCPPYVVRPIRRVFLGACLTLLTVFLSWVIPYIVLRLLAPHFWILASLLNIFLVSTTIAWKGLVDAGRDVHRALIHEGLHSGRAQVSQIVGRDTAHLSSAEVVRATVETLAENIVDAIAAPVFFAIIGGAPMALAYRAANTLDSMVGYKNDRYRLFGRVSARLDDVLNYVPARLTVGLLSIAIALSSRSLRRAWMMLLRDAKHHPSPNAGIPESMVAGALGVQLGGINTYHGVVSRRATMGDETRALVEDDIITTIRLVNFTSIALLTVFIIILVVSFIWGKTNVFHGFL